jgi:hypothetical protein
MPFYTFQHPNFQKTIDVFFKMNDEKKYIDEDGLEWNRVFYPPLFAFDTMIDPNDPKAFVKKTEKGGTLGDIMDLSKEMSERRGGDKNDEIKVEYTKNKENQLQQQRLANLREERKKQFKEFQKLDKSKVKARRKTPKK